VIAVTGGQFLPNEQMSLYWDTPSHVAGSATADTGGSFNTRVKPFAGDSPGVHKLCASVPPNPCANFALQATPSPSPSASPTPSPSPSPSAEASPTPSQVATAARVNTSLSGFDVITHPPFVFLPIFGFGAIALSLLYWAVMVIRRPRRHAALTSAAVVHRATRPDYSAGFGTAPPAPRPSTQASAWDEPMRTAAAAPPSPSAPVAPPNPPPLPPTTPAPFEPAQAAQPAQAAPPAPPAIGQPSPAVWSSGPAVPWGPGTPDAGYPDLGSSEALDRPYDDGDIPQPGD